MAFGAKAKEMDQKKARSADSGDGEQKVFDSQWMPTGSGTRLFYVLPSLGADGKVELTERKSPNGKPVKRNGAVLYGLEPAEETVFAFAWWPVMVNGEQKNRRLMFNPDKRYDNPLWEFIDKKFPKAAGKDAKQPRERSAIKLAFAMNVLDTTPVMRNAKGQVFYPAESGDYTLLAFMNNGKVITDKEQLPDGYDDEENGQPLNAIRILEGSYGKSGGKHLFQDLADMVGTIENTDGILLRLPEVQLRMRTTGKELDTKRTIRATANFKLPDESYFYLPRYNLAAWTAPWPDEAIERLIAGDEYSEIVEEYELVTFPALDGVAEEGEDHSFD